MVPGGIALRLLVLAFVGVLMLALVQAAPAARSGKAPAPKLAGRVVVLLDTSRLVAFDLADGKIAASAKLGGTPKRQRFPGRFLARSADGRFLYVLVNTPGPKPDHVAVLAPRTLDERRRLPLADGVAYRGISVGPTSGRVFAYGNVVGKVADRQTKQREQTAAVTILDPTKPKRARTHTVRKAAGHDWWTYWGAVSPDEKLFYLSYHGGCAASGVALCTTGADWVALGGKKPTRCKRKPATESEGAGVGCLGEAHGVVEPYGKLLYATTGGGSLVVADRAGKIVERLDTKIEDTHLMSFALDRKRGEILTSSCGDGGGLSIVGVENGKAKRVAKGAPCASVLAYVPGRSLAALASRGPESPTGAAALTLVNVRSGKSIRQTELAAEPLDLAVEIDR